jgi:hypothetical protein
VHALKKYRQNQERGGIFSALFLRLGGKAHAHDEKDAGI